VELKHRGSAPLHLRKTRMRGRAVVDYGPKGVKKIDARSTVAKNTTITIQATASDDVGVTRVEFYVGSTLTCTDTTSPYTCSWKVPKGASQQFSLQARAYDARGNVGTSAVVQVTSR